MAVAPILALESPWSRTFDDPALEWRRLFSEFLGTFFLVLVGAGGAVVDASSDGAIGRAASVTAPGLLVLGVILYMGAVSGAHLNPAVTLSFALRGDFPWRRVPGYIVDPADRRVRRRPPAPSPLRRRRRARSDSARSGLHGPAGCDGGASAHRGTGQHHPRHGVDRPERRAVVGARRRWLHRPGRSLVESGQRGVDESCALLRTRADHRRLQLLLGLPGRPRAGGRRRGRPGLRAPRQGR